MKNKYFRYVLLFLVGILLVSCKKEEKIEVKGREYITESGFSNEATISVKETKELETTTEKYDIKKHPEDWSMTNKETCLLLFNKIFQVYDFDFYIDETKLPISQHFREKYNIYTYSLGLTEHIKYDDIVEIPHSIEMIDEEFEKKEFRFYGGSAGFISRESKFKYLLDVNNKLDEIVLLKTDVKDYYAEMIAESIANRPKSYEDLERYKKIIPDLFDSRPIDYEYFNEEEANEWRTYIRNYYEGCTDNFFTKYDPLKGIVGNVDEMIYSSNEKEEYTNLENKCVGVTVDFGSDIKKNYKVYFEVDDRNFLDSITKVEEVLEDGTVVEVENNFGK